MQLSYLLYHVLFVPFVIDAAGSSAKQHDTKGGENLQVGSSSLGCEGSVIMNMHCSDCKARGGTCHFYYQQFYCCVSSLGDYDVSEDEDVTDATSEEDGRVAYTLRGYK